jgi:integrase
MNHITELPTLSNVIARLQQAPNLTPTRRRDLVSAVLRISEMTGVDPRTTPASLRFMRPLTNRVRPAKYDQTPKTWANLRSNFRAALVELTPRERRPSDPEWSKRRAALPTKSMRLGLSRFIGFCDREGIAPNAVCDAVSDRFRAYLETDTQVPDPHDCHRAACRLWNKAAETVAGWPSIRLKIPVNRRQRQSIPIDSFPLPLRQEFAAYIESLRITDLFAEEAPQKALAPSTVQQRAAELGLALSALVASGREAAGITSLAMLVEPEAFKTILRRYLKEDGTARPFARNIAQTLVTIARRWVRVDPAALDQLCAWQRRLGYQKGFTEKNRTLINTLEDPAMQAKLLFLPDRLAHWAERMTPGRGAVAFQLAVAVAILQIAPLRIANLAGLRLDQHLVRPGGPRSLWQIDIAAHETKNNQALVYELPRRTTALVDRYIRHFRPSLAGPGNPFLFPVGSRGKTPHKLSQQIRRVLADWVGIYMTAHQFRHHAGRVLQRHSPGAFAAIAALLGHKDVKTAMRYYSELDTLSAGRHFDEILEAERSELRPPGWRPS